MYLYTDTIAEVTKISNTVNDLVYSHAC